MGPDKQEHRGALWAADCAEHVLECFEEKYPEDRPASTSRRSKSGLGAR